MLVLPKVFRPGIRLMLRLPLRIKSWMLVLLAVIPMVATLSEVVRRDYDLLRCTQFELHGIALNRSVYAVLGGALKERRLEAEVATVGSLVAQRDDRALSEAWRALQAWHDTVLEKRRDDGAARDTEGLMLAAWRLLKQAEHAFHFFVESSSGAAAQVELAHVGMLNVIASIQRLRGELATHGRRDLDTLQSMQAGLAAALDQVQFIDRVDGLRGRPLGPSFQAMVQAARELVSTAPRALDPLALDSTLSFAFSAHDEASRRLQEALTARAAELSTRVLVGTIGGLSLVSLLFYLVASALGAVGESHRVLRAILTHVRDGELRYEERVPGRGALAAVGTAIDEMTEDLSLRVGKIRNQAIAVWMAADAIADANRELLDRTELTAANLAETTSSVQSLDALVAGTARAAQETRQRVVGVRQVAEGSVAAVTETVQTMRELQLEAGKMVAIIGAIDGIAFQTNILALNASVEAARAGVAGRGFAVVADEVRSLAQRCAESAHQVRELIERSNARVEKGAVGIEAVSRSLQEVVSGVCQTADTMSIIAEGADAQVRSLREISGAVQTLDSLSQVNSSMVDRSLRAAEALRERSFGLGDAMHGIHLRRGTADEAYEMLMRAKKYLEQNGLTAAKTAMHDQNGEFRDRDLYIFGFDRSRLFEIYGANPAKAGHATLDELTGVDADYLFKVSCEAADRGGDWIEYDVRNPFTGEVEPKVSYVIGVGSLVLGCGVYRPILKHEREAAERARREQSDRAREFARQRVDALARGELPA
ncbi:MAG: methyl-accepting chemotaxis protein [Burkholderiaceae bacterium]